MINYIKIDGAGLQKATRHKPVYGLGNTRTVAGNPDVFVDGKWYNSSNGDEKAVDGTYLNSDRLTSHTYVDGASTFTMVDDPLLTPGYVSINLDFLVYGTKYEITATTSNIGDSGSSNNGCIFFSDGAQLTSPLGTEHKFSVVASVSDTLSFYVKPDDTTEVKFSVFETEIIPDTPYSPQITYLDGSIEIDIDGNEADIIDDFKVPDIAVEKIVVDEAEIKSLVVTDGFDLGQNSVDVTSERLLGVEYLNDTGKPIEVISQITNSAQSGYVTIIFKINSDIVVIHTSTGAPGYFARASVSATIPNGSTYQVDGDSDTSASVERWHELR